MKEFTFDNFRNILLSFRSSGYKILSFLQSLEQSSKEAKHLILRHDVDRFPNNALHMAQMEAEHGIKGTYYFRIIPSVFKPDIIKKVADAGHEIGYHYEDLSLCHGDFQKSIIHFEQSLKTLRLFYPVKTICMHGSPLSKWNNKTIWQKFDYRNFGIIADTSFDINYDKVFYISDNGRAWNRFSVSIRDKVDTSYNIPIKDSKHLIDLIKSFQLPDQIMINAHPDTFFDFGLKYMLNWGSIELKNFAKWFIVKYRLRK